MKMFNNIFKHLKFKITNNSLLLYKRLRIFLIRCGVSENTKNFLVLSTKCSTWIWQSFRCPRIPNSFHTFLFVWAPSDTNPCTFAPAFSNKTTAFIINWVNVKSATGPFEANTAIGWVYECIGCYITQVICLW